ncbi:hypothetical protein KKE34_04195 [Patescibacteria group bacterium]|nr:hypothetical protein [Patescibacteria group bacterium]
MTKKKKEKSTVPKTNFSSTNSLRSFLPDNQRIDQKNYRQAKIHMPRRPK